MTKKARGSSMEPSSPVKLVLTLHSPPPSVTPATLNDVWEETLRPAVARILRGDFESIVGRKELLYRQVERLVKLQFSKLLLEKLESEINEYCSSIFTSQMTSVDRIVVFFDSFMKSLDLIARIFNSLDRELFCSTSRGVCAAGYVIWKTHMCRAENDLSRDVVDSALKAITAYRKNGTQLDLIKRVIHMLHLIGIFSSVFERNFLDASRQFYSESADHFLVSCRGSVADFVDFVLRSFEFETAFSAETSLPSSTWKSLDSDILRTELILNRLPKLIEKDLISIMRRLDIGKLKSLYELCLFVNEKLIVESVFRHSLQNGISKICSEASTTVDGLIKVRRDMKCLLSEALDSRPSFQGAYKDAMESVLNSPERSFIPARLAEWTDVKLLSLIDAEEQSMSDSITEWSEDMMGIFKLLTSKDIFEFHYRSLLCKRLIYISANYTSLGHLVNQETAIVNLLKQECGAGFTSKLESMIRDVALSEEMTGDSGLYGMKDKELDLRVTVATTGVWPLTPWPEHVKLPQGVHDLEIFFARKFMEKNEKKSLKFLPQMTSAVIQYMRREFVCSAAQALVLCLFNSYGELDEHTAGEQTGLPEAELSRAFKSLEESGILTNTNGLFEVNQAFKPIPGTSRISLNQYQYRRGLGESAISEEERAQTEASVIEDRQHQLDAAIVRVMKKARKSLPSALFTEVLNATKFNFSKQEITKRISILIDREFLEKDPGDDGEIRYLA
jgi:cullin-4